MAHAGVRPSMTRWWPSSREHAGPGRASGPGAAVNDRPSVGERERPTNARQAWQRGAAYRPGGPAGPRQQRQWPRRQRRPAQAGRWRGTFAKQPLYFPQINETLICKPMSPAFLRNEPDKESYLRYLTILTFSSSQKQSTVGEYSRWPNPSVRSSTAVRRRRRGLTAAGRTRWWTRLVQS